MNDKRQLSSDLTMIVKCVFPTIFYGSLITAIIGLSSEGQYLGALAAFFVLLLFGTIIYFGLVRLKSVKFDNEYFYISNYLKTIEVPVIDLVDVSETWLINTHPIVLHFKTETSFGKSIMFMPNMDISSTFSTHPITKDLRQLLKNRNSESQIS